MTAEPPDPYASLGIHPRATQAEIGHAYRALLRRHHPDTRGSADESQEALSDLALQQILAAYAVLGDPAQRAHYDRDVTTRSHPAPRRSPAAQNKYRQPGQPPIVAGPVRWHRAPKQPPP